MQSKEKRPCLLRTKWRKYTHGLLRGKVGLRPTAKDSEWWRETRNRQWIGGVWVDWFSTSGLKPLKNGFISRARVYIVQLNVRNETGTDNTNTRATVK